MNRDILAGLGLGWCAATIIALVSYAIPEVPFPLRIAAIIVVGFSATLFWINRR